MLYLIKQPSFNYDESIYRIGYTKCLATRIQQYLSNCPETKTLEWKNGGTDLEAHLIYTYLSLNLKIQEEQDFWFKYSGTEEDVKKLFTSDIKNIENNLWKNKDKISNKDILEYLNKIYSATTEKPEDRKTEVKRIKNLYKAALDLTDSYRNSNDSIGFSDTIKPTKRTFREASYRKSKTLESSILLSFKKGKFYKEDNLLFILEKIYKDFGITNTPKLKDLTTNFTLTRVYKDRSTKYRCKERTFYIKLM